MQICLHGSTTWKEAIKQFMEMKGKPVIELSDSKWLCDLAFMVDIAKYLSELNVKLQGPNQLLSSLFSNVKSFEAKLKLWQVQLEKWITVHFPTLQEQKPAVTSEYADECEKLLQAFGERFQDLKTKQQDLNMFPAPFTVEPADVPANLQLKMTELQSNDELKGRYNNLFAWVLQTASVCGGFSCSEETCWSLHHCLGQPITVNCSFQNWLSQSLGSTQDWLTQTWKTSWVWHCHHCHLTSRTDIIIILTRSFLVQHAFKRKLPVSTPQFHLRLITPYIRQLRSVIFKWFKADTRF